MAWLNENPECGLIHDERGGTFICERSGLTLAEEFPEQYFIVPRHAAWLLDIAAFLHGLAMRYCYKWRAPKQEAE